MTASQPLRVGVARGAWRKLGQQTVADNEFRAVRPTILARDQHTCVFCRVQSDQATEVHHEDGDHTHNDPSNLLTACVMCHPVNHLGNSAIRDLAPSETVGQYGSLLVLPGISQADLSHLARTIGHVLNTGTDAEKEAATSLHRQLASHSVFFESTFGPIKVRNVAQALVEIDDRAYVEKVPVVFDAVRVWFKIAAIKQLASRFAGLYKAMPIASWPGIANQRLRTATAARV